MGYFVTIEGIEGAGKSTLRSRLSDFATAAGLDVVLTREPGATTLGQSVREIVLDPKNKKLNPYAELMLFAADRAQHVEEILRPSLDRGALVICDRYIHSTLAYQGYGRGLDLAQLRTLNDIVTQGLKPDLVLLLDLSPDAGLDRARARARKSSGTFQIDLSSGTVVSKTAAATAGATAASQWTRFEEQDLAFHQRLRAGFLELSRDPANRFVVIDAEKRPDDVAEAAIDALKALIGLK